MGVGREREREGGRESEGERGREREVLFHLVMHSLSDSGSCPDQGSNPQPWHIWMML